MRGEMSTALHCSSYVPMRIVVPDPAETPRILARVRAVTRGICPVFVRPHPNVLAW